MIDEPIGSPSGNAPNEAAEPTRRVTAPDTMIAPGHGTAGDIGATDEAATEHATTAPAPTEQATTAPARTEQASAERTADRVAGGGTDADPSDTDRARTNGGAEPPAAADSGTDRGRKRLGYAKTVAGVLIAYAALRGLCMAFVLTWGYRVGITPVHLFDRFDMSNYIHIADVRLRQGADVRPGRHPENHEPRVLSALPGHDPSGRRHIAAVVPLGRSLRGVAVIARGRMGPVRGC